MTALTPFFDGGLKDLFTEPLAELANWSEEFKLSFLVLGPAELALAAWWCVRSSADAL